MSIYIDTIQQITPQYHLPCTLYATLPKAAEICPRHDFLKSEVESEVESEVKSEVKSGGASLTSYLKPKFYSRARNT